MPVESGMDSGSWQLGPSQLHAGLGTVSRAVSLTAHARERWTGERRAGWLLPGSLWGSEAGSGYGVGGGLSEVPGASV